MASYNQLSKYNWQVVVSLGANSKGARQRIKKQRIKTKKEAEFYVTNILNKKNKGYITPTTNNILFKDFIVKWFNEYKSNTIGLNTKNNYLSRINYHIIPELGHYKLTEITTSIIQDYYNSLINDKKLTPSSAKKIIETLGSCFKYAKKNKLIYDIPTEVEKVKLIKPKIGYWTKSEVDFFLSNVKNTYIFTPTLISLLTGLRVAEVCGLRWSDVDLEENIINVTHQIVQDKISKVLILTDALKTNNSYRSISIPKVLKDHLKALKTYQNASNNDFVITDRTGGICNPRNLSMNFTKYISKFKLSKEEIEIKGKDTSNYMMLPQITFHGLRHTHATILIFSGENIKIVSERLGHKDVTITLNTYAHIMDLNRKNTADTLNMLFSNI